MPALGYKGKGGGEKGKGAEEEECFHFLKRISGDDGDDDGGGGDDEVDDEVGVQHVSHQTQTRVM